MNRDNVVIIDAFLMNNAVILHSNQVS